MVVIQFRLGSPKQPVNVTVQEEEAEEAVAQYLSVLKALDDADEENEDEGTPPTGTSWFKPPVIN